MLNLRDRGYWIKERNIAGNYLTENDRLVKDKGLDTNPAERVRRLRAQHRDDGPLNKLLLQPSRGVTLGCRQPPKGFDSLGGYRRGILRNIP